jgi:hypothetical protein
VNATPAGLNPQTPGNFPPVTAMGSDSFKQVQDQLAARGVTWQSLVGDTNGWKFRCSLPNRDNPAINRAYEASAANYLDAIRAVLEKIDQERR